MIAAWVRRRRKELGLTQAAIAQRIGVTQPQVSSWENRKSEPSREQFAALLDFFGPHDAPQSDPKINSPTSSAVPPPLPNGLERAQFVRAEDGRGRGIGKLVSAENRTALVEYFDSLTHSKSVKH